MRPQYSFGEAVRDIGNASLSHGTIMHCLQSRLLCLCTCQRTIIDCRTARSVTTIDRSINITICSLSNSGSVLILTSYFNMERMRSHSVDWLISHILSRLYSFLYITFAANRIEHSFDLCLRTPNCFFNQILLGRY